jgi:hypothetical protein
VGTNPFPFQEITVSGGTGNYFKVPGLTQSSLTIEVSSSTNNADRGPITGLQIVNVIPEPASLMLLVLGLLGLTGIRRIRKP